MNRLFGRYPSLNRGLVLLVTLLLPPTTAAAVLHAIAQERAALSAPSALEMREGPREESQALVQDEERADDAIEPTAPAVATVSLPSAPSFALALGEEAAALLSPAPPRALRAALARRSAPRAPPA